MFSISVSLLVVGIGMAGVEQVRLSFGQFPPWVVLGVLAAFGVNLIVVSFRLGRLLSLFGVHLPWSVVSRASLQGHFAALFLISLFGQVAGRHWVLRHHGTPSVFIATLTALERAGLLLTSGGLCLLGIWKLLDGGEWAALITRTSLPEIALAVGLAWVLSLGFVGARFERQMLGKLWSWRVWQGLVELLVITGVAQVVVLGAFTLAGLSLAPQVGWVDMLAAAAIISFAASLPISVNGWGVREVAAVFAFGQLGIPSSSALAVSILIGLCSSAVILAAYPMFINRRREGYRAVLDSNIGKPRAKLFHLEKIGAWGLSVGTAVLVFFQMHVALPEGVLNLNLADGLALIALAAVVTHSIATRQFPVWRVPGLNFGLAALSLMLLLGFWNGVLAIGVTQWALAGRLMGWLVLLGYLSVGLIAATYLGRHGLRQVAETMVVTVVVVVLITAIIRLLAYADWGVDGPIGNFEGFAGNRNAFALQLLVCLVLLIAYADHYRTVALYGVGGQIGATRQLMFALFLGVILAGLVFSASRAGIITGLLLLAGAGALGFMNNRMFLVSLLAGSLIWFAFTWFLPWLVEVVFDSAPGRMAVQSLFSNEASNIERWETIRHGMEMWRNSPLIGGGLGAFIEGSSQWFDEPIVIHSTPVWLLAEFGLLGAGVVAAFFARIILPLPKRGRGAFPSWVAILLVGVFGVFSLVHEVFYQRIFWLALGVALALPYRRAETHARREINHATS